MATPKTLVSVEPISAMIQKAQNLLAEAQALGQQYVAHSHDIMGTGWGGDASMTSTMVSEQVQADLNRMVASTQELMHQLNNFQQHAIAQEESARHALQSVHPGGGATPSSM
jgi:cell division protein FtsB